MDHPEPSDNRPVARNPAPPCPAVPTPQERRPKAHAGYRNGQWFPRLGAAWIDSPGFAFAADAVAAAKAHRG